MNKRKKKIKYDSDMPKRLYCFFATFNEAGAAPSIEKFAQSIGATRAEVMSFRAHSEFERAYRECLGMRRDYLIDRALTRRFDPSFVKFVLEKESEDDASEGFVVKVEVVS